MAAKLSADVLLQMAKSRRTIYQLNKTLPVPASRVRELVEQTTLHTPSSFNSQSNRVVLLLGEEHDRLWDFAAEALRAIVPAEQWSSTAGRIAGFKAAAGSALFFTDDDSVKQMQDKFPTYSDRFPVWADQSLGMQQHLLWTALELEGLGANLQHYNPLIDQKVAAQWNIPASWKLNAQLVFGGRAGEAGEKTFKPLEERVKVFGSP
ncbi:hypothetical protein HIM_04852 [Hirsutella minnesotensis 3608]|uniref:Nitroreductase domain-containing protein n=1 Tax=Hirsutella minnesotensis 3608 TaxID=1043627 RepID=A0A0F7ZPL2_9HYPO|nr:hypothetical protein HIM_04852 [Hirsutella minnesotensis 3608]